MKRLEDLSLTFINDRIHKITKIQILRLATEKKVAINKVNYIKKILCKLLCNIVEAHIKKNISNRKPDNRTIEFIPKRWLNQNKLSNFSNFDDKESTKKLRKISISFSL